MEAGARRLYSSLWTGEEQTVRIVVTDAYSKSLALVRRQHRFWFVRPETARKREDLCKMEQMARTRWPREPQGEAVETSPPRISL